MLVLVLNAGSSSLKFNLFDMGKEVSLAEGMAERLAADLAAASERALAAPWPDPQALESGVFSCP